MSPIAVTSQTPATEVPSVKETPQVITKSSPVENLILTTYPEDSSPIPLQWGAPSTDSRGPIIATRYKEGLAKHNAIGAHSGSYCVYHALAVGTKQLDPEHVADYTNSQPAFAVPEQKTWYNDEDIVAMDPFGHLTPYLFDEVSTKENVEIRPTIAVTKATMQLFEMKDAVEKGRLEVDGEVVINKNGDLNVSKVAVEPVWYLPGVAKRFGVTEEELRKALFEDTNGMYPELVTRPDIKVFLPPIGGLTVYIFGNPDFVSDPSKKLALRVHDECNGCLLYTSRCV